MRRSWQPMAAASAFATAALTVSTLFAASATDKGGPMMGRDSMMGRMGQMMDHCSQMMGSGSTLPNEQWKKSTPPDKSTPDKKG